MGNKHRKFQPYDRVLVRGSEDIWQIDFYSHWSKGKGQHITLAYGDGIVMTDRDILPYEGNEHLVGTTDEPEEEIELKEGEIVAFLESEGNSFEHWGIAKFYGLDDTLGDEEMSFLLTPDREKPGYYLKATQVIRFSDFNPSDMEETRKHILCVKNGKIIRYKE